MRRVIALLFAAGATLAAYAGVDPESPLGTNLVGVSDFSDEFPFVDLMKSARDWIPGRQGCFDCREPGGNPACNAPNVCPTTLTLDADGYPTTLDAAHEQEIRTVLHAGSDAGRLPPGDYTLRFDGAGTINVFGGSVVQSAAGQIVFNVASSAGNNIGFQITALTQGNPIRNIRVLPPGGVCANDERRFCDGSNPCASAAQCLLYTSGSVAQDQLFQPRFLKNTEPYRLIRYMDWMGTNSSPVVNVADYPKLTSPFYTRVPPEILAELGNRLSSDVWINIPHRASNAFVDDFATRLRDTLDASHKVYIEYGNENWNGIFSQNLEIPRDACPSYADLAAGCQDDGIPMNGIACERDPDTFSLGNAQGPCFEALVRRWADRSVEVFDRFYTVFGSEAPDRLVRVVAAQAANADLGRQVLDRGNTASKTDAYAIAPYFGTEYCTPGGVNPDTSPSVYASVASLLAHIQANSLPEALSWVTDNAAMLSSNGFGAVRLISYEGGQHLAGVGNFTFNATCNTLFDAANASATMGTLYQTYLEGWHANGGNEFVHFYDVGRWGVFGRWGALEFQDQAPASSPKYTVLTGFVASDPCWWTGCDQSGSTSVIFKNGFEG